MIKTLLSQDIQEGELVIKTIEENGNVVDLAVWCLDEQSSEWSLFLSVPNAKIWEAFDKLEKDGKGMQMISLYSVRPMRVDSALLNYLGSTKQYNFHPEEQAEEESSDKSQNYEWVIRYQLDIPRKISLCRIVGRIWDIQEAIAYKANY